MFRYYFIIPIKKLSALRWNRIWPVEEIQLKGYYWNVAKKISVKNEDGEIDREQTMTSLCSAKTFGFYPGRHILWPMSIFKEFWAHQGKNMPMRDSNTWQTLLGIAWTVLLDSGSPWQYESVQRLPGKEARKYLLV